ncbi:MAG TPA: hypothetical protein VFO60_02700 [Candidatus Dormibacteraeota bacterium]|nr:hypothetical protein [Candidatus Dormibacteraeota bacterium]
MSVDLVFGIVCAGALVASALVVGVLRTSLRRVLVDLCEGEHRAAFWSSICGVWIVLVALLAGSSTYGYWAGDGSTDIFGGVTTQLRLLLVGLLGAVLAIAIALLAVISGRNDPSPRGRRTSLQPPAAWPGPQPPAAWPGPPPAAVPPAP